MTSNLHFFVWIVQSIIIVPLPLLYFHALKINGQLQDQQLARLVQLDSPASQEAPSFLVLGMNGIPSMTEFASNVHSALPVRIKTPL